MKSEILDDVLTVAKRLDEIKERVAFLGGAIVGLLLDDPAAAEIRPTKDVDAVVEILTRPQFGRMEEQLRAAGFKHDMTVGVPICRWLLGRIRVDIMPVEGKIIGIKSRWFKEALINAHPVEVETGKRINVVAAPFFLATKLEAFRDRGKNDFYGSHDLEDLIAVLDGCSSIVEQVHRSPVELKQYLAERFQVLLSSPQFVECLPGHLPSDPASRKRSDIVLDRMKRMTNFSD